MEDKDRVTFKGFLLFFIFLTFGYSDNAKLFDKLGVKSGYMIFREGTELVSDFVASSDGSEYSHVGMLYKKDENWMVIHATPSEKENQKDSVIVDELEFFIDKNRSKKFAIYEVNATKEEYEKAVNFTLKEVGKDFHYDEDRGTYCTLLLYRAWQKAGVKFDAKFKKINFPLLRGEYLFINGLVSLPQLNLIYKSSD